jgi:hypothetical protein
MSIEQDIQKTIKAEVAKLMANAVIDYDGICAAIIKGIEKELPKQILLAMNDDSEWILESGILDTIINKCEQKVKKMEW